MWQRQAKVQWSWNMLGGDSEPEWEDDGAGVGWPVIAAGAEFIT